MTEFFLPLAFYRPSFTGFNEIIKLNYSIILPIFFFVKDLCPNRLMLTFLSNFFVLYLIKRLADGKSETGV